MWRISISEQPLNGDRSQRFVQLLQSRATNLLQAASGAKVDTFVLLRSSTAKVPAEEERGERSVMAV